MQPGVPGRETEGREIAEGGAQGEVEEGDVTVGERSRRREQRREEAGEPGPREQTGCSHRSQAAAHHGAAPAAPGRRKISAPTRRAARLTAAPTGTKGSRYSRISPCSPAGSSTPSWQAAVGSTGTGAPSTRARHPSSKVVAATKKAPSAVR